MLSILKVFDWLSAKMLLLGGILLVAMVVLTCVDVVGRMFGYPVFGTYELISFMAALVVAVALPATHTNKMHIGVELLTTRFSTKTQNIIELITDLVALILFAVVAWRMFLFGFKLRRSGEVSMNLGLPEYMITLAVGFGFLFFTVAIVKSLVETLNKLKKR